MNLKLKKMLQTLMILNILRLTYFIRMVKKVRRHLNMPCSLKKYILMAFTARFLTGDGRGRIVEDELEERSRFVRRAGRWLYLDAL